MGKRAATTGKAQAWGQKIMEAQDNDPSNEAAALARGARVQTPGHAGAACRLGGAPVNKLSECGTFIATETLACKLAHQVITDVSLEHLEKTLIAM